MSAEQTRAAQEEPRGALANTLWQFVDKAVRLGVGFTVGIWVIRYLGPEAFGKLSFALAFVSLFSPLAGLGLDSIITRELVHGVSPRSEILGSAFALKLIGSLLAIAFSVAAIGWVDRDPLVLTLAAVTAAALFFQPFDVIEYWFQARLKVLYSVLAKDVALVLASALRIVFILSVFAVTAFAWAWFVELALGAVCLLAVYIGSGERLRGWRVSPARAKALLRDSWPFIFSNVMIMIYMRIDQIMLGKMVGAKELGIYSVAVKLTEAWYFIPMAVVTSTFPGILAAKSRGDEFFEARLQKLYGLMAGTAYAIAIPVTILARPIVNVVFGEAYGGAVTSLQILIWSVLFTNLGVARSSYLTAMNWAKVHLFTVSIGGLANVLLNMALIPRYGAAGAAGATLVAYWLAAHGTCFLYPPLRRTGRMLTRAMFDPRSW